MSTEVSAYEQLIFGLNSLFWYLHYYTLNGYVKAQDLSAIPIPYLKPITKKGHRLFRFRNEVTIRFLKAFEDTQGVWMVKGTINKLDFIEPVYRDCYDRPVVFLRWGSGLYLNYRCIIVEAEKAPQ
ncbi:MAG TPA: hypothetical protein VLI92_02380 [Candidatus Saccharimonadales bacterium]|nr:hypothetical protein [Candidatus Saccharimonadales bacterium]